MKRRALGGLLALAAAGAQGEGMLSVEIVGIAPVGALSVERRMLPYAVQTGAAPQQGETLAEAMARTLAGVNLNEVSGSPYQHDLTYRGFRASPLLGTAQGLSVYLDGVRVNEPFGDVVNWDMLPEAAIGRLLLVPGSNPLYGLNTLGGALVLTTRNGLDDAGVDAGVSVSSHGRRRVELSHGVHDGAGWHAYAAATLFRDRGWRDDSPGRLARLFAKAGRRSPLGEWDVSVLAGGSRLVGNGLLPDELYEANRRSVYTSPDRSRNQLRQVQASLRRELAGGASLSLSAYARSSRRDGVNGDIAEPAGDDDAAATIASTAATGTSAATGTGTAATGASTAVATGTSTATAATAGTGIGVAPGAATGMGPGMRSGMGSGMGSGGVTGGATGAGPWAGAGSGAGAVADGGYAPASLNTAATRQRSQGVSASLQRAAGQHRLALGATFDRSSVSFAQYSQPGLFGARRQVLALDDSERELEAAVDGTARSAALFASDTWSLTPRLALTAAARFGWSALANTLRHDSGAAQHERFTYRKLNPALGFAYEAAPGLSLFANAAQSNRVPTVIELGCADPEQPCRLPVGLQSDPYLKQVVARTLEAGMRWKSGEQQATLALYRTNNRDDILFRTAGLAQHGYFANFPRTRHQGADLSASLRGAALQVDLAYSFLDAEYGASGSLFTGIRDVPVQRGTRMAGLPRHTFKLGVDWHATPALTLGAALHAVSGMAVMGNEDGAQPGWRIAGHALLSLHASYRAGDKWSWQLRVNNATNRRYESFGAVAANFFPGVQLLQDGQPQQARFVAPGAPLTVTAGLNYQF